MINFDNISKVYLITSVTDLRKGIDGYTKIIQDTFKLDPFEDTLYIFMNKHKDKMKVIYWDTNGFWLLYKRLEKGKFKFKRSVEDDCIEISHQQLKWLLEGLNISQEKAFKAHKYLYV